MVKRAAEESTSEEKTGEEHSKRARDQLAVLRSIENQYDTGFEILGVGRVKQREEIQRSAETKEAIRQRQNLVRQMFLRRS